MLAYPKPRTPHIKRHEAADTDLCHVCHKHQDELYSLRGFDGRYCWKCLLDITEGLAEESRATDYDSISGYLVRKHMQDTAPWYLNGTD